MQYRSSFDLVMGQSLVIKLWISFAIGMLLPVLLAKVWGGQRRKMSHIDAIPSGLWPLPELQWNKPIDIREIELPRTAAASLESYPDFGVQFNDPPSKCALRVERGEIQERLDGACSYAALHKPPRPEEVIQSWEDQLSKANLSSSLLAM